MNIQHLIKEWRKGCSNAPEGKPERCEECTRALIDAIERQLRPALGDVRDALGGSSASRSK